MKRIVAVGIALFLATGESGEAQEREVTGTVSDAATGLPIANAAVLVVGQRVPVCTNGRGQYTLRVRPTDLQLVALADGFRAGMIKLGSGDRVADLAIEREDVPRSPRPTPTAYLDGVSLVNGNQVDTAKPVTVVNGVVRSSDSAGCGSPPPARKGAGGGD